MVKNMRLIDADALKKAIPETTVDASTKYRYCVTFEREDVLAIIDAALTVDIVRPTRSQFKRMAVQLGYEAVIHCRECKEHRLFNGRDMCAKNATILDGHEVGLRATRADFYCADGERRTNEKV